MAKQLIIHIGPPKTATTSLQTLLQNSKSDSWLYLGVRQDRTGSDFSDTLLKYVRGNHQSETFMLNCFKEYFQESDTLVVSEEMLVLPTEHRSTLEMLRQLNRVLVQLDVEIRFVYIKREIESVVISLYQELFPQLFGMFHSDFHSFCRSYYMDMFNLKQIKTEHDVHGFELNIHAFSSVISLDYELFQSFGIEGSSEKVELPKVNRGSVECGERILYKKSKAQRVVDKLMRVKPSFLKSKKGAQVVRKIVDRSAQKTTGEKRQISLTRQELESLSQNYQS